MTDCSAEASEAEYLPPHSAGHKKRDGGFSPTMQWDQITFAASSAGPSYVRTLLEARAASVRWTDAPFSNILQILHQIRVPNLKVKQQLLYAPTILGRSTYAYNHTAGVQCKKRWTGRRGGKSWRNPRNKLSSGWEVTNGVVIFRTWTVAMADKKSKIVLILLNLMITFLHNNNPVRKAFYDQHLSQSCVGNSML